METVMFTTSEVRMNEKGTYYNGPELPIGAKLPPMECRTKLVVFAGEGTYHNGPHIFFDAPSRAPASRKRGSK